MESSRGKSLYKISISKKVIWNNSDMEWLLWVAVFYWASGLMPHLTTLLLFSITANLLYYVCEDRELVMLGA